MTRAMFGLVLVVVLVGYGQGACWAASDAAGVVVQFRIIDVFGRSLPYRVASFIDVKTGRDMTAKFDGLKLTGVSPGRYRYRFVRTDQTRIGSVDGEISVDRYDLVKVLIGSSIEAFAGGRPASADFRVPQGFAIRGEIHLPSGVPDEAWVHLSALYQDNRLDLPINADGSFSIPQPLDGAFTLTVLDRSAVLCVVTVAFHQGFSSARFTLGDCGTSPAVISVQAPHR
jgi:hypothetical protein